MSPRRRSLSSILITSHLLVTLVALALSGVALDRILEKRARSQLQSRAQAEALLLGSQLIEGVDAQALTERMGTASGTRFTVIDRDGVVLSDSEHDPASMQNHASRPEVEAALTGRVGVSQRSSQGLGKPFLYVALPVDRGLVVRAGVPSSEVEAQRRDVRKTLLATLAAMVFAACGLAILVARSTAAPLSRLSEAIDLLPKPIPEMKGGSREVQALADVVRSMSVHLADRLASLESEREARDIILSSVPVGIALSDTRGSVSYMNPAALEMLGETRLLNPARFLDGPKEVSVHHPEPRLLSISPVEVDSDRVLIVIQDVTQAKRLDAMRRDFVAHASHELKTPVGAMLAVAETIATAAKDDPASMERFAPKLVADAGRMARLINDLLDLARLDEAEPISTGVDAAGVVTNVAERMRSSFEDKGILLRIDLPDSLRVLGSNKDLDLILTNLLENALRYTEEGEVVVTLTHSDGNAELRVADSGLGIPASDLPRVFERFYRVDAARSRSTGGTGLGLAIVRHAVERTGGSVDVVSELGRGSTFMARIPMEVPPPQP